MIDTRNAASSPEQVRDLETKRRNKRTQEENDLRKLLNTPEGIRFFRRLFVQCNLFSHGTTGDNMTFFNNGVRSVALKYFEEVRRVATSDQLTEIINMGD